MNAVPPSLEKLTPQTILDTLNDGVYVTDLERRIVYWSRAAQEITGWPTEEVIGRTCFDQVLCHTNQNGHALCGEDLCPLHHAIANDRAGAVPMTVFARGRDGRRIPMSLSVAPLREPGGRVVGGVESFRDLTKLYHDLERARHIQNGAMGLMLPGDAPLAARCHYVPYNVIGGDFYIAEQVKPGRVAFMIADAMGHGVSAALYTMQLRALWNEHRAMLGDPLAFAMTMNHRMHHLVSGENAFASAAIGVYDAATRRLRIVGAGSQPLLLFRQGEAPRAIGAEGLPLGLMDEAAFDVTEVTLAPGDTLLLFTDGAIDVNASPGGEALGLEGLMRLLAELDYPGEEGASLERIEEELLLRSGEPSLNDDLTLMELRVR